MIFCIELSISLDRESASGLLELLKTIKGKFMLTMYPNEKLKNYITQNNWCKKVIERTVSAAKNKRRKQEEWIVMN